MSKHFGIAVAAGIVVWWLTHKNCTCNKTAA